MELLWLVLSLLAVDLAALLFAADTRPGLQHSSRRASSPGPASVRPPTPRSPSRPVGQPRSWPPNRRSNKG